MWRRRSHLLVNNAVRTSHHLSSLSASTASRGRTLLTPSSNSPLFKPPSSHLEQKNLHGFLGLCGFPMPKECNSDEAPPLQPSNFHDGDGSAFFGDGFGWKAVAIGYGSGFVFGVTVGYVVFRTRKPAWFMKVVEDQWNLKARRTKKNARRNGARRN